MMKDKDKWASLIEFLDQNFYWNYIIDQSSMDQDKQKPEIWLSQNLSPKFIKLLQAIDDYDNH